MPNFDTPQPITAVVEIAAGSIRLVASDRDDTVAEVRPRERAMRSRSGVSSRGSSSASTAG